MWVRGRMSAALAAGHAVVLAGCWFWCAGSLRAQQPANSQAQAASQPESAARQCAPAALGSPFVPVDSWVYPAVMRLYSLGYVDTAYLGLRPWTRTSLLRMLEEAEGAIEDGETAGDAGAQEAREIESA